MLYVNWDYRVPTGWGQKEINASLLNWNQGEGWLVVFAQGLFWKFEMQINRNKNCRTILLFEIYKLNGLEYRLNNNGDIKMSQYITFVRSCLGFKSKDVEKLKQRWSTNRNALFLSRSEFFYKKKSLVNTIY